MNDESVKRSLFVDVCRRRSFEVFLLVLASLWVLVFEDEVDLISRLGIAPRRRGYFTHLVGRSTFVRPKHDDIR